MQTKSWGGASYDLPDNREPKNTWGEDTARFLQDLADKALAKTGGLFDLTTEDIDFGPTYGLISAYYKSRSADLADDGIIRLAKGDMLYWRNNVNNGNIGLGISASDRLQFGSVNVPTISSTDTLTNKTISGSNNTITNIPLSAFGALTASRALVSDGSGVVSASAVTATQLLYLSGASGTSGTGSLIFSASPIFTGSVGIGAGSVTAPGLAFSDDADGSGTGLYRVAANTMGFAANGVQVGEFGSAGWTLYDRSAASGSTTPGLTLRHNTTTTAGNGAYLAWANASGTRMVSIRSSGSGGGGTAYGLIFETYNASANLDSGAISASGAFTLGPLVTNNYTGQRHLVSGGLFAANVTSTAASGNIGFGVNVRYSGNTAEGGRTDSTTGGAGIYFSNDTTVGNPAIRFYANAPGDATNTTAAVVGSIAHSGSWALNPTSGDGIYTAINRIFRLVGTSNHNVAGTTPQTSSQITASVLNSSYLRLVTASGAFNLDGMVALPSGVKVYIENQTGQTMTVRHNGAGEGTSANQINTPTAGSISFADGTIAEFMYSSGKAKWLLLNKFS